VWGWELGTWAVAESLIMDLTTGNTKAGFLLLSASFVSKATAEGKENPGLSGSGPTLDNILDFWDKNSF
jgi:hypothetical protein